MTYVIAQPCVDLKDRACVDECPVDCIYEGNRMLYIHPDECVDCGACEPVCPVEAIFYEDDTPEQWKDYYTANVDFFDDLGSPGGAAKLGVIDKDHPLIAALPPAEPGVTARPCRSAGVGCPDFPWDHLTPYAARARAHEDGIVDLSVGTPVDPTPAVVREALAAAADSPGYPTTVGRDGHPAGLRGLALPSLRRDRSRPRRRAAGDRLQGADRLAADPARPRRRRPGRAPRRWPTRPTRSAPVSPAPARSPPTR